MSDKPEHEGHDEIRKLLQGLPKVEASPDFEQRLARRIREGEPARAPERRLRIPVFATTVLALLLVGVVSYIAFLRPTELVTPPEPDAAPSAVKPVPSSPAPTEGAETRPVEARKEDATASQPGSSAPSGTAPQRQARSKSAPASEAPVQAAPAQAAPTQDRSEEVLRSVAPPPSVAPKEEIASPPPEAKPVEAPAFAPSMAPQRDANKGAESTLRELQNVVIPESGLRRMVTPKQVGLPEREFLMVVPTDSAAIDTSAVDSLRKIRKPALPVRKRRPPRPGE